MLAKITNDTEEVLGRGVITLYYILLNQKIVLLKKISFLFTEGPFVKLQ